VLDDDGDEGKGGLDAPTILLLVHEGGFIDIREVDDTVL
jgi:hypothetical protein